MSRIRAHAQELAPVGVVADFDPNGEGDSIFRLGKGLGRYADIAALLSRAAAGQVQSLAAAQVGVCLQRGAAAVFTEEGMAQIQENLGYYKENARILSEALDELGIWYTGGKNSPYIWLKCPNGMESWEFFDYLLENANVVGTPGAGFGENGKNFFRLTAFGDRENTIEAVARIKKLLS